MQIVETQIRRRVLFANVPFYGTLGLNELSKIPSTAEVEAKFVHVLL